MSIVPVSGRYEIALFRLVSVWWWYIMFHNVMALFSREIIVKNIRVSVYIRHWYVLVQFGLYIYTALCKTNEIGHWRDILAVSTWCPPRFVFFFGFLKYLFPNKQFQESRDLITVRARQNNSWRKTTSLPPPSAGKQDHQWQVLYNYTFS